MPIHEYATFTSPDQVWEYLALHYGDPDRTVSNTQMETWINSSTAELERKCGRRLAVRDYTSRQNGSGSRIMYLDHYPVVSVGDVTVSDSTRTTTWTLQPDVHFIWTPESGQLYLLPLSPVGCFWRGIKNVQVQYRAGFSENDMLYGLIQDAIHELIAARWFSVGRDPTSFVRSESAGTSGSQTYIDPRRNTRAVEAAVRALREVRF